MPKKFNQIQKSRVNTIFESNFLTNQTLATKLQQAIFYHKTGELEHAKVIYEDIVNIYPKHFDALQLLGVIAAQMKDWETAVRLLTQALTIDQSIPAVYNNLGVAYKELGLFDEALKKYNKLKRLEEGLESYETAINLNSAYAEAYS